MPLIASMARRLALDSSYALIDEAQRFNRLQELLARYVGALMAQISISVACHGLHPVEKCCCGWLLMTHDRVDSDALTLTQDFLAIMLGVRRATVSEVLEALEQENPIRDAPRRYRRRKLG